MNSVINSSITQNIFTSFNESLLSLTIRDKKIVVIVSVAFGILAAVFYIFKYFPLQKKVDEFQNQINVNKKIVDELHNQINLNKKIVDASPQQVDLKEQELIKKTIPPIDLRPKNDPDDIDLRHIFGQLSEDDLPDYTWVKLTTDQTCSLDINNTNGISVHFPLSYFATIHFAPSDAYWMVARVPRILPDDLPLSTPVLLSNVQVCALRINEEGLSAQDCFAGFKFHCEQYGVNQKNNCEWIVTREKI